MKILLGAGVASVALIGTGIIVAWRGLNMRW